MPSAKVDKVAEARNTLPLHLHKVFDKLVRDYVFHGLVQYDGRKLAPKVLAALVEAGWRLTDD